jgi:signal transduction histidine kinase
MSLSSTLKELGAGMAVMYRRYAEWLVSISWKRFIVLSILLMIAAGVLSSIPPFSTDLATRTVPAKPAKPGKVRGDVEVSIDEKGIQIKRRGDPSSAREINVDQYGEQIQKSVEAATRAAEAAAAAAAQAAERAAEQAKRGTEQARRDAEQARRDAEEARRDVEEAKRDAEQARHDVTHEISQEIAAIVDEVRRDLAEEMKGGTKERVIHVRLGDHLPPLAFLFIMISAVMKVAYTRSFKAEVRAAAAKETADAESLRRQVVEARMAAMQAQVEPHFLFNTLASIDHLIEVDPPRASRMQKNLIALLRASMPAMREKATNLGRELEVVKPYLEILKVRMEDRLQPQINVSEGLNSADFPPMMLQSLVENAIKHGLEPKADGGTLTVAAEVAHGKLQVSVADTGVGFAQAPTAGTGTGLNNIRERLHLIYGDAAELRIAANSPTGTRATIVVPYKAT